MTYKESKKLPFIERAPSNDGLFKGLYEAIAKDIGCKLIIHRIPKARGYILLKEGKIDFYPSGGYKEDLRPYLYFVHNGLYKVDNKVGLSPKDVPPLKSLYDIKKNNLFWVAEIGGSAMAEAKKYDAKTINIAEESISRAIEMLEAGRRIFYVVQTSRLESYIKSKKDPHYKFPYAVHHNLFKKEIEKLYLGFSRKSPLIKWKNKIENGNRDYKEALDPECVAYRFIEALERFYRFGKMKRLIKEYNSSSYEMILDSVSKDSQHLIRF